MYKVIWTRLATKQLQAIDSVVRGRIIKKVEKYLVHSPEFLGKRLTAAFEGYYRYRVGDYRALYTVDKNEIIITVVGAGHRSTVYKKDIEEILE